MDKKYILFDLDGTLTDSNLGITRCVQYALLDQGIDEQNMNVLQEYIGPALEDSFRKQHGLTNEQTARAVAKYRERYADIGIFENEVYDGIAECLAKLKSEGKILALSTCKPEPYALRILEHFGLSEYFDVVTGAELSGARKQKVQVIEETFNRLCDNVLGCEKTREVLLEIKAASVMVGDRNQDVNGAHQAEIECIGVRYGYAKPDELEEAGADYIVENIAELTELILS
jgi:phosphoglycolate phosphatase